MRYVVFALLVAVPAALIGWVVGRGHQPPPAECVTAAADGTKSVAGSAGQAGPSSQAGPAGQAGTSQPAGEDATLKALLRLPLAGLTFKGKVTLYDGKGLFDYINGAAPVYIKRHFRRLAAVEMGTPDGGELTCDIYDMGEATNAASIFDLEKSPNAKTAPSWPEAIVGPKSFVFRQGRYYTKLTAFDDKAEAVLPKLAQALKARMQ